MSFPAEETTRFEALTTPRQSWNAAGFRVIVLLLVLGASIATGIFLALGAWPVAGFMGLEVVGVVALLLLHRRWSSRTFERIRLADGVLRVDRADGRGRRESATFDAYWARVRLQARPGQVSELRLTSRGRSMEIGRFLQEMDKAELAEELGRALAAYQDPRFVNPQLQG